MQLNGHDPQPNTADLELAVQRAALPEVFRILASWDDIPEKRGPAGTIDPALTVSALLLALKLNRADIVSLLLCMAPLPSLPIKEAILAGHCSNFQAFLWQGWDINEPVELDGPSALG